MPTIFNFQMAASVEDEASRYWNKYFCVNQTGDSSGPYIRQDKYDSAVSQNADLLAALRPFAALWSQSVGDKPDDTPIYGRGDAIITAGDVKAARAAIARAEGGRVMTEPLFSIWQRFRRFSLNGSGHWGLWACTYHIDMPEIDVRAKLAEIEADELERRARYSQSEAIYEIRPSTKGARVEGGE